MVHSNTKNAKSRVRQSQVYCLRTTHSSVLKNAFRIELGKLRFVLFITGYCTNLGAGTITVRVHVGDCPGYGNYDAYTGWNSASRIIVREVPASPY